MAFFGVSPAINESVSAVTATNSVDIGTVVQFSGEEYVYVYNAGNSQISVGNCAVMSAAVSGYSVTVSSTTNLDFAVGFAKHATLTTGTYGWLLARGFTKVVNGMASTALAAGDPIMVMANGVVQVAVGGTGATGAIIGKMMTATGSAGTAGQAFVRCFGV